MKKIGLLLTVLLFCSIALGQQSGAVYTQSLGPVSSSGGCTATAGTGTSSANTPCGGQGGMFQNSNVKAHTIVWTAVATVSACTIEMEQSSDGVAWSLFGVQQTCTSSGSFTFLGAAANVRVNINSLTTSGAGSLTWTYTGQVQATPGTNLVSSINNCGATTTCANALVFSGTRVIMGTCPASAATTCVVTGISPAFSSTSSYFCNVTDNTTAANNALRVTYTSTSSFTITTASSSDVFTYVCIGT